jgi:dihydrofolate reductase
VYAAALPRAHRVVITELRDAYDGDVIAPVLGPPWHVTEDGPWQTSSTGIGFRIRGYGRS